MTLAAAYVGDRRFRVEEGDPASPGPGEVRVDVAFTGICGTDLHVFHGHMDQRVGVPAVLGHEASGRIGALGEGVDGWSVGDQVTVMPLAWCGECPACRAGHSHVCQRLVFVGLDSPGSMQQAWIVPASLLVALPADMALELGALVEPAAVAVHDVRRAELRAGEHTVVVGGGPIGLLIAAVARAEGARVMVSEPHAGRRRLAEGLGFGTLDPTGGDIVAAVEAWTDGAGAAVAVEASGSEAGLGAATQLLAVRGRLVAVGIHPRPVLVDLQRVFWRELSIIGARVYERTDFETAVALLAGGALPARELISDVVPLADTAAAFATLDGGDAMKILLDCRAG